MASSHKYALEGATLDAANVYGEELAEMRRRREEAAEEGGLGAEEAAQEEAGGAGAYSADLTKTYRLADPAWARDVVPEIWDGKNVADFVDPDVEARLEALEAEEDAAVAAFEREQAAHAAALPPPLTPTPGAPPLPGSV